MAVTYHRLSCPLPQGPPGCAVKPIYSATAFKRLNYHLLSISDAQQLSSDHRILTSTSCRDLVCFTLQSKRKQSVHSTRLKTCASPRCPCTVHMQSPILQLCVRVCAHSPRFVCLCFESYYLRGSAWRNPNYMAMALSANTHFIIDNVLS